MRLTACLLICLLQVLASTADEFHNEIYSIVAPSVIRSNQKYAAAVTCHRISEECEINIGISGPSFDQEKNIKISTNEIKYVEWDFPMLERGDYNLYVLYRDDVIFKPLNYTESYNHVIIKTDKSVYQPGDQINFAVLFFDKNLNPADPEDNTAIWFEDGNQNRIEEIKGFNVTKGVYISQFRIPEFPVVGRWHIGVSVGDEFITAKNFEVKKFVLPQFVVKVEATEAASIKDDQVKIAVSASYINGIPLIGKVTINSTLYAIGCHNTVCNLKTIVPLPHLDKTVDLFNGRAIFFLNVMGSGSYLDKRINIASVISNKITVQEELLGASVYEDIYTKIYPMRYVITCLTHVDYFEADKEHDVVFLLAHANGSYLNDTKNPVELIYKNHRADNDEILEDITFTSYMNETGFVHFKVLLHNSARYTSFGYEIKYRNEQQEVQKPHVEKPKDYFILTTDEEKTVLTPNKPAKFTLKSSKLLSYFDYYIIGLDEILKSERVVIEEQTKIYNLTLIPKLSWMPRFVLRCSYVDENGVIHSTNKLYDVKFEIGNQINITAAGEARTGEEMTLEIETTANSFIALMAVDQNSLKKNNDKSDLQRHLDGWLTITNAYNTDKYSYPDTSIPKISDRNLTHATLVYPHVSSISDHDLYMLKFPEETWLFTSIENFENAQFTFHAKSPAIVSSWEVTAFSMNPSKGLAVTREPTKISTFRSISISTDLPYSVKKGERIRVVSVITNNLSKDVDVTVTLENTNDEFEFVTHDNKDTRKRNHSEIILVLAKSATAIDFFIKPKVTGNIELKFNAASSEGNDTVLKTMNVIPEGVTQYRNRAYFINLKNCSEFERSYELEFPEGVVPGSHIVKVLVAYDILDPVLNHLDNLVGLAKGCVEHVITTLQANYFVMKHLKSSNRLSSEMATKLTQNMENGYRNIFSYRHKDGSFSTFGPNHYMKKGSTLLTAQVVRSFLQIKEYVYVCNKTIEDSFQYLIKQQDETGEFSETNNLLSDFKNMDLIVTSSAVLAISENNAYAEKYSAELTNAKEFIAEYLEDSDSTNADAIGVYALCREGHESCEENLLELKSLAEENSDEMWWGEIEEEYESSSEVSNFYSEVEIASYALLSLLEQKSTKLEDVLPIINFLIAERNSFGGFASVSDTAAGLLALFKFAEVFNHDPLKINFDLVANYDNKTVELNKDVGISHQMVEMQGKSQIIDVRGKGTGSALIQVADQYNTALVEGEDHFTIETRNCYDKNRPFYFEMEVCVEILDEDSITNMVVLEISIPSGYVIDDTELEPIRKIVDVMKIELLNSGTLLVIYIDYLVDYNICFTIKAIRTHYVDKQKPASIVMYDYYDITKRTIFFYTPSTKLCEEEVVDDSGLGSPI